MTAITMAKALNVALRDALARDDRVLVFGQDVGPLGGVFRVTDGLAEEFGRRAFNTPLAEGAIAGVAVGLAIKGFRPVAEMQLDAFSYPAFEQVASAPGRHCHLTARASPAPAPTPLSWRTGPPFTSPWPLPRQPLPRAPRSKSLTCGVSRRSIWRRWRPRCARPVVRWWCMRPLCSWVSAPRLLRGSCTTSSTYSPLRSSV